MHQFPGPAYRSSMADVKLRGLTSISYKKITPLPLQAGRWHRPCSPLFQISHESRTARGFASPDRGFRETIGRGNSAHGHRRWSSTMASPMRKELSGGSCPYLERQADLDETLVPAHCRDPASMSRTIPGFWEYWNRCLTVKHIHCPRYRRHRRRSRDIGFRARMERIP